MFTAIAIVCSLESGGCFSVANEAIFLTLKDCQDNAYTAQTYAEVNNLGQSYVEYNVESGSSKWVLSLMKQAGLKTVPQIFSSDGTHIGGYTELRDFLGNLEGSKV